MLQFSAPYADAWIAPLVAPRARAVRRAASDGARVLGRPLDGPRAGLAAAIALGTAWTWGSDVDRPALRLGAAALEVANALVFHGPPSDVVRLARALDAERLRASVIRLSRRPVVGRVLDRLDRAEPGVIPEAVLLLRAAVAVGVVVGDVDDAVHAALDEAVTFLGLAWEGDVDADAWEGALGALPLRRDRCCPHDAARAAVAKLPPSAFAEALADAVDGVAPHAAPRPVTAWRPHPTPALAETDDPVGRAMAALVAPAPPAMRDATAFLRLQGGKRVRPRLVIAAAAALGGAPPYPAAAAVEWVHLASLVLDDILDAATHRRGHPALYAVTDRPFAAGVAAFVLSRVRRADLAAPVAGVLARAAARLADGQASELVGTGHLSVSEADHHRIIAAKTASLFAASAEIGALSAGADPATAARFRRFGHELGLAFQLVDDVLDYTGDLARLGKAPGTDLRAGKATLPLILLRDRVDGAARVWLAAQLADPSDPAAVLALVRRVGTCDDTLARARVHHDRAVAALLPHERTPALQALARDLVERDR